jgi:beta-aspartyl-peptidase (threonine type)
MTKAVIVIHGGAGTISRAQRSPEKERQYIAALSAIVESGQKMLNAGESALDVVTEAVRLLEECPLFNAGIGSVFTRDETHELDACVMDGYSLRAGAVAGVSRLRNPILAARLVMERSPHVLLVGEGAEKFAFAEGMEPVSPDLFPRRSVMRSCLPPARRGRPRWITAVHRWMKRKNGHRWCGGAG